MELVEQAYNILMTAAVWMLAALIILSIVRSVLGPGISDRMDENYLADVCLIYAMISFLGVVVLCKVYTGVYLQRKHMKADLGAIEDNLSKQGVEMPKEDAEE